MRVYFLNNFTSKTLIYYDSANNIYDTFRHSILTSATLLNSVNQPKQLKYFFDSRYKKFSFEILNENKKDSSKIMNTLIVGDELTTYYFGDILYNKLQSRFDTSHDGLNRTTIPLTPIGFYGKKSKVLLVEHTPGVLPKFYFEENVGITYIEYIDKKRG